jgi:hypothetical protein
MDHSVLVRRCQVAFTVALLTLGGAARVCADSITLSNVQLQFDLATLSASVSAGLEAHSDTASSVFLDALSVSLVQAGTPVDLTAGPTTLDDTPFFANTPISMLDGETLAPVVLFRLLGLVPGASYAGSFFLAQGGDPLQIPAQMISFTMPSPTDTPVPEPASLWLLGTGAILWGAARWRKASAAHLLTPCRW